MNIFYFNDILMTNFTEAYFYVLILNSNLGGFGRSKSTKGFDLKK